MKRTYLLTRSGMPVLVLTAAGALLAGCADKKEERSSVGFHTRGVRRSVARLRRVAAGVSDRKGAEASRDMRITADNLGRALAGVPARVDRAATDRKDERKAAARKAMGIFKEMRPSLESLQFDLSEVKAKLDEIDRLMDVVDAKAP